MGTEVGGKTKGKNKVGKTEREEEERRNAAP